MTPRGEAGPLQELLGYFGRIAQSRVLAEGAVRLTSPRCPVIGVNAVYPTVGSSVPPAGVDRLTEPGRPLVVAGDSPGPGAREVLSLRVGTIEAGAEGEPPGMLVVEQVSRLQSNVAADVLCDAWGTPTWAGLTGRWLAEALEGVEHQLLVGYADVPVGMVLVLDGAAHLWGCVRPELSAALLRGAAGAWGEPLRVSAPAGGHVHLAGGRDVTFWLVDDHVVP